MVKLKTHLIHTRHNIITSVLHYGRSFNNCWSCKTLKHLTRPYEMANVPKYVRKQFSHTEALINKNIKLEWHKIYSCVVVGLCDTSHSITIFASFRQWVIRTHFLI